LILGQNEESAHILLRKKPAARHCSSRWFFICINHKRADKPIAAKFKAALQKRRPITLNNSRDHYSRSKYTTQVLFSHTHGLFRGCFDEIFDLYNDIQDDFRVIFHSLQKDTFVEYLTGKEYDEYFG
jgi:hypothetical protein